VPKSEGQDHQPRREPGAEGEAPEAPSGTSFITRVARLLPQFLLLVVVGGVGTAVWNQYQARQRDRIETTERAHAYFEGLSNTLDSLFYDQRAVARALDQRQQRDSVIADYQTFVRSHRAWVTHWSEARSNLLLFFGCAIAAGYDDSVVAPFSTFESALRNALKDSTGRYRRVFPGARLAPSADSLERALARFTARVTTALARRQVGRYAASCDARGAERAGPEPTPVGDTTKQRPTEPI